MSRTERAPTPGIGRWFIDESKDKRDKKKWHKPPKWFKKMRRQSERAKLNEAARKQKELPIIKHDDQWDWN